MDDGSNGRRRGHAAHAVVPVAEAHAATAEEAQIGAQLDKISILTPRSNLWGNMNLSRCFTVLMVIAEVIASISGLGNFQKLLVHWCRGLGIRRGHFQAFCKLTRQQVRKTSG